MGKIAPNADPVSATRPALDESLDGIGVPTRPPWSCPVKRSSSFYGCGLRRIDGANAMSRPVAVSPGVTDAFRRRYRCPPHPLSTIMNACS